MATEVLKFENRDEWLKARAVGISSTDVAVIMGVSPYKSPLQLYYEKRGEEKMTRGENEALWWGITLEGPIATRYELETERSVRHNKTAELHVRTDPEYDFARATVDAIILAGENTPEGCEGQPGVLEIKNVSNYVAERWQRGEPPIEFQLQLQWQLFVTDLTWGSIAALVGGSSFRYADIKRDDELITMMLRAVAEFRTRVAEGVPPPADPSEHTSRLLAILYPKDNGETVELPPEAIEWDADLVRAAELTKEAKQLKDRAGNLMKAAMGEATFGLLSNGIKYTLRTTSNAGYTVTAYDYRALRRSDTNKKKTKRDVAPLVPEGAEQEF